VTSFGKPYMSNGFGNWFRDLCDQAGRFDLSYQPMACASLRAAAGALRSATAIFLRPLLCTTAVAHLVSFPDGDVAVAVRGLQRAESC
jgi:hypothetical protein